MSCRRCCVLVELEIVEARTLTVQRWTQLRPYRRALGLSGLSPSLNDNKRRYIDQVRGIVLKHDAALSGHFKWLELQLMGCLKNWLLLLFVWLLTWWRLRLLLIFLLADLRLRLMIRLR